MLYKKKLPYHIAIMMDGNRRWAKKNNLSAIDGYKKGAQVLKKVLKASLDIGIKVLTVYAFSTENWNRSKKEIFSLMSLFEKYLKKYTQMLKKEGVRLKTIGDLKKCPKNLQEYLAIAKKQTEHCKKIDFVLAINYGAKDEIVRACKKIIKEKVKYIDEYSFTSYLDTHFCQDPDLLIRTSGESRLSNFLLWQISYAEIYFTKTLWPDFSKKEFLKAIDFYNKKDRRFGSGRVFN